MKRNIFEQIFIWIQMNTPCRQHMTTVKLLHKYASSFVYIFHMLDEKSGWKKNESGVCRKANLIKIDISTIRKNQDLEF